MCGIFSSKCGIWTHPVNCVFCTAFLRVSLTRAVDCLAPAHLILLVPNYLSVADDLLMNSKDSARPLWVALNTKSEPFALLNGLSELTWGCFCCIGSFSVSRGTVVKPSEWATHSFRTVDVCVCGFEKWYERFSLSDSAFALGLGLSSLCLSFTSDDVSYLFSFLLIVFLSLNPRAYDLPYRQHLSSTRNRVLLDLQRSSCLLFYLHTK